MLIEFSITNWRSIKTTQTLSMLKGMGGKLAATHSFIPDAPGSQALLNSAVLYGANAAGKSNVLSAIQAMEKIVLNSATESQHGEELGIAPFRLSAATEKAPTEFEISFITNKVRYQYGFAATQERITEEWLFAYPAGRPQQWIGRTWDAATQTYQWAPCAALKGKKKFWQESTRANALFLSTAVQWNAEQLQPVFDWFRKTLRTDSQSSSFTAARCQKDENYKDKIVNFLKAGDLDIVDIHIDSEKMSEFLQRGEMPEEIRERLVKRIGDKERFKVQTVHLSSEGNQVLFDLSEESDGTQKFFSLAAPLLDILDNGYVVFVDELHNHLHPKMMSFLVRLFHSKVTNPKNAQLIFTTHETSILNQDTFRNDQIWFCEKDQEQATRLYSLSDFKLRSDRENLEAYYLAGRFGAVPYIANPETLLQESVHGK